MDCIVENCTADCLGRCRRWILGPVLLPETEPPKSSVSSWVSAYLQQPKRTYRNCLDAKKHANGSSPVER